MQMKLAKTLMNSHTGKLDFFFRKHSAGSIDGNLVLRQALGCGRLAKTYFSCSVGLDFEREAHMFERERTSITRHSFDMLTKRMYVPNPANELQLLTSLPATGQSAVQPRFAFCGV